MKQQVIDRMTMKPFGQSKIDFTGLIVEGTTIGFRRVVWREDLIRIDR